MKIYVDEMPKSCIECIKREMLLENGLRCDCLHHSFEKHGKEDRQPDFPLNLLPKCKCKNGEGM